MTTITQQYEAKGNVTNREVAERLSLLSCRESNGIYPILNQVRDEVYHLEGGVTMVTNRQQLGYPLKLIGESLAVTASMSRLEKLTNIHFLEVKPQDGRK